MPGVRRGVNDLRGNDVASGEFTDSTPAGAERSHTWPMTTFPVAARVAVAAILTLPIAACGDQADVAAAEPNGVAEMRPAAAVALAAKTLAGHDSVTFTGTLAIDGRPFPGTMVVTRNNTCEFNSTSDRGRLTVRQVGRNTYIQANAKALMKVVKVPAESAAQLADAWISVPTPKKDLNDCRLGEILPTGRDRAKVKDAGTKEIDGRIARGFSGRDEDGPMTVWVATTGAPDVLLMTGKSVDGAYTMSLAELDADVEISAPAKSRRIG